MARAGLPSGGQGLEGVTQPARKIAVGRGADKPVAAPRGKPGGSVKGPADLNAKRASQPTPPVLRPDVAAPSRKD